MKSMEEEEEEEEEFQRQWQKRQDKLQGIIVVMGPPYIYKTMVAKLIGKWAQCLVLCIEDFIPPTAADDIKNNVASNEEVLQRAFTNLCRVARRHLVSDEFFRLKKSTVVIKSRLNSTFELQRLLELVTTPKAWAWEVVQTPLLVIECRIRNEYLWKQHFGLVARQKDDCHDWYRPQSWEEVEKARDEYYHPQSQADWDLHFQQLILEASNTVVRRLVVDTTYDITSVSTTWLPDELRDAIRYLLTAPKEECVGSVSFGELRPYLLEKRLRAILEARGRRKKQCPYSECIFKYWEELIHHHHHHVCGVCGEPVVSGTPAYTCHLCIHTLHKSCAERIHFKVLDLFFIKDYYFKASKIPTIFNHDSHPTHFLSLMITDGVCTCMACGKSALNYVYSCKPCGLYYHPKCVLLPLELLEHEHGGHEHVMKLVYSGHHTDDGTEPEESYWCEVCYKDMDPQLWFYSCQNCPYYVAHLKCARGYDYLINDRENAKFVQQIQSQLEDAMAQVNGDSETSDSE